MYQNSPRLIYACFSFQTKHQKQRGAHTFQIIVLLRCCLIPDHKRTQASTISWLSNWTPPTPRHLHTRTPAPQVWALGGKNERTVRLLEPSTDVLHRWARSNSNSSSIQRRRKDKTYQCISAPAAAIYERKKFVFHQSSIFKLDKAAPLPVHGASIASLSHPTTPTSTTTTKKWRTRKIRNQ